MRDEIESLAIAVLAATSVMAQEADPAAPPITADELRLESLLVKQGIAQAEKAIRDAEAVTIAKQRSSALGDCSMSAALGP